MANVVVLGLTGTPDLWLVDFDAGTVTPIEPSGDTPLGQAENLRQAGLTIVKGVDVAVAASSASGVASGILDVE
ncbi:hypothetical protein DUT91_14575 [Phyllobacterium salinisoli]|uniref:Uncharacterized protein n=1 Tax=Phyllobacterium salinisoli TaxID=1899321 RepID=A0A368K272_9HYPH|nr:hypothetical protein [Phyllobacterium salinisoli]RCS23488.1 hypothetical protein DUT91_14575 [Phyllobacterium salinisoli]